MVGAVLFGLYRAYTRLTERHKNLETLHDFTRSLGDAVEIDELEEAVARGAREILRGEHVALLLPPVRDGVPASRLLVRGEDVLRANVSPAQLTLRPQPAAPPQRGPAVRPR